MVTVSVKVKVKQFLYQPGHQQLYNKPQGCSTSVASATSPNDEEDQPGQSLKVPGG